VANCIQQTGQSFAPRPPEEKSAHARGSEE
jgi:hypothetical protein